MKFFRKIKRFFTFILFFAITWMLCNKVVFMHSHILKNNQIVSHCHPFNKSTNNHNPFPSHNHTENEFILLNQLNDSLIYSFIIAFIALVFLPKLKYSIYHELDKGYISNYLINAPFRVPPYQK